MFAIIKDNKVICTCNMQPNANDLASRNEYSLETNEDVYCGWDYNGTSFSPPVITFTLAELKEQKWTEIKAKRDSLEREPLPYMGKLLDFDSTSSERLNWAISTAQTAILLNQPFSIEWTCYDNSTLLMTREDVLGIPIAVAMRSDSLHKTARNIKEQIDAAENESQVKLIEWR